MMEPPFFLADEYSAQEKHQIIALARRIGKACSGKPADIVAEALKAIVVDAVSQLAESEAVAHEGIDAFCGDAKSLVTARAAVASLARPGAH